MALKAGVVHEWKLRWRIFGTVCREKDKRNVAEVLKR